MQIKVFIRAGRGGGSQEGPLIDFTLCTVTLSNEGGHSASRTAFNKATTQTESVERYKEGREERQRKKFSTERATGIKKPLPLLTPASLCLLFVRAAFNFNSLSFCPGSHPHPYKG